MFDGGSFVIGTDGTVAARCLSFSETVDVFDVGPATSTARGVRRAPARDHPGDTGGVPRPGPRPDGCPAGDAHGLRRPALGCAALATRDYVHKSGFSDVCVGLSGGVDSSLTAAIAVDALGADHVHGVLMPSRHSSEHSVTDAEKLAANLGIDALIVGIEPGHAALAEMIGAGLGGGLDAGGITDQNLQSRIRGVTLMALANEHGWLVLTPATRASWRWATRPSTATPPGPSQ